MPLALAPWHYQAGKAIKGGGIASCAGVTLPGEAGPLRSPIWWGWGGGGVSLVFLGGSACGGGYGWGVGCSRACRVGGLSCYFWWFPHVYVLGSSFSTQIEASLKKSTPITVERALPALSDPTPPA